MLLIIHTADRDTLADRQLLETRKYQTDHEDRTGKQTVACKIIITRCLRHAVCIKCRRHMYG